MKNLYLLEMGMNDNNITTDVKNHRVRVVENIDIEYQGKDYNMFFEFTQCAHYNYRKTNKRTGAPLKKAVQELIIQDGLGLDTQFEKLEKDSDGREWFSSWRNSQLEREIWNEHHAYTKKDIRDIVNKYAKEKYTGVILIEEEARHIINTTGGYREKYILAENADFQTEGSSYMEIGNTWNNEHKIVRVNRQEWEKTENGRKLVVTDFCEVDLVTGKITN